MSASAVTQAERDKLEQWTRYLNLDEMAAFCRTHDLPLYIHVERPNGRLRRTSDRDRKDIVLRRMLDFALDGKRSGPTIYSQRVVSDVPLPVPLHGEVRVLTKTRLQAVPPSDVGDVVVPGWRR